MVGPEADVVAAHDGRERLLLRVRIVLVVLSLLRQVFLDLAYVSTHIAGRRKDGGDVEGHECRIGRGQLGLCRGEQLVVLDRIVDRRRRKQRVEPAPARCGIVLLEHRIDDGTLGDRITRLRHIGAIGLEVVHMEPQHIAVLDGVRDGVGVQPLLEHILGGLQCLRVTDDALLGRVLVEDRGAGEAEELRVGEEFIDRFPVVAELRSVALIEDEDDPLIPEHFELR